MFAEYLPMYMFVALGVLLFTGFPVAFILGGVGLGFAFIGMAMGEFNWLYFQLLPSRIIGDVFENTVFAFGSFVIFSLVTLYGLAKRKRVGEAFVSASTSIAALWSMMIGAVVFLVIFRFLGGDDLWFTTAMALGFSPLTLMQFSPQSVVNLGIVALMLWQATKALRADWRAV